MFKIQTWLMMPNNKNNIDEILLGDVKRNSFTKEWIDQHKKIE